MQIIPTGKASNKKIPSSTRPEDNSREFGEIPPTEVVDRSSPTYEPAERDKRRAGECAGRLELNNPPTCRGWDSGGMDRLRVV